MPVALARECSRGGHDRTPVVGLESVLFALRIDGQPARASAVKRLIAEVGTGVMTLQMAPGQDASSSEQAPPESRATMKGDALPLRWGLLDRDWRKALVVLLTVLAAPVETLAGRMRSRLAAIVTVYLIFGVTLVGGLILLAGPFVGRANALLGDLPRYAGELEARSPELDRYVGKVANVR